MRILPLMVALLASAGCKVTEKQVRSYPQLARVCADEYPIKTVTLVTERVEYDTITLPGGTVQIRDTIPCPDGTRVPVQYQQPCPPVKVVTQTVYRDSTVQVEDTRRVAALRLDSAAFVVQAAVLQAAKEAAEKQARNRLYVIIGIAVLVGIGISLKISSLI